MDRSSRRYADDVSARVDRVIRSIRSTSPIPRAPVYIYESPVAAICELNRIDNECRTLAVENDLLRSRVNAQTDLIIENDRVHRDLSKVALENEVLKIENRRVPEYEQKLRSMMRTSQDLAIDLNHTAIEANQWKNRFDEADISAARYRSLYQNTLLENERQKNDILDAKKDLANAAILKAECDRLNNQNYDLADARNRLSHELLHESQENAALRDKLKQIDVLKAQLAAADQEKKSLRDIINNQNDIANDLRDRLSQSQDQVATLKVENSVIPSLKTQVDLGVNEATKLTNMLMQQEKDIKEQRSQIANLSGFEQKVNQLQNDKQRLQEEQQRLNDQIIQKLEQVKSLQGRAAEADVLDQQVKYLEEDKAKLTNNLLEKSRECETLKVKAAAIPGLEDRIESANKSRDALSKIISEREGTITDLNRDVAQLKLQISEQNRELAHLDLVHEQNERLRSEVDKLYHEADDMKVKLARYAEVEHKLVLVQGERENLSSLLTSKLEHVRELNLRINDLEEQLAHLNELKAKVVLVVEENETLNKLLVDKIRANEEWSIKYDQLERLYATVKQTTEELDHVKNKYASAVRASETTNPNLRNSVYTKGRGDLYSSRYSEANTMGSPSDLLNSPPRF